MTLGNVRGQVLIGRLVNISVPVQLDPGEAASAVCVEVEISYADNRLDSSRVSSSWQNPEATGEGLLLVRTNTVVDEPVIGFNLRAGCVRRTERRYVLLADVPAAIANGSTLVLPVVQPVPVPATTTATPLPAPAMPPGAREAAAQATPSAGAASAPSRASLRAARRAAREEAAAAARASSANAEATAHLLVKPAPEQASQPPQAPRAARKPEAPPAPAPVAAAVPAALPVATAAPAVPAVTEAKPPVKAAVAPPPPVVAAPEAKSRLKLEALPDVNPSLKSTLELVTAPSDNDQVRADAKALWQSLNALPAESLQESQRLRALDSQNKALQETVAKNQAVQDGLKSQLAKAEEERYTNGLVGGLAALLVCAVAGAGYLWVRVRRMQAGSNRDWWRGQSVEPSILSDLAPVNDAAAAATTQRGRDSKSGRDSRSGKPSRAPDVDLGVDESIFDSLKTQPSRKTARKPSRSVASSALDSSPPRSGFFNSSMGARSVNVEELFDIQQQAEFFVSLGQHDQAIELLRQHIYGATSTSGLAYLDLLQLYHRFNRRQEYDQLRDEFNHSFNAQVPQFEQFNQQSRGLEHYTSAIERIVALWKSPRILQVLQDSIFRKPEVGDAETFDLEAYRELLLLFAIAKEVADANPGVTGAAHDSNHAALGRSDGRGADDIPSVFSTAGDPPLGAHTTPLATARSAPLSLSPVSRLDLDASDSLSEPDFILPKASPRLGLDVDLFELESAVAPLNGAQAPGVDLSLADLDLPLAAPSPPPPVFSASSVELDLENYLNEKKNAAEGRPKS